MIAGMDVSEMTFDAREKGQERQQVLLLEFDLLLEMSVLLD